MTTRADRNRQTADADRWSNSHAPGVCALCPYPKLLPALAGGNIGVISPSGNEVGPFLSIEQASLAQLVSDHKRTRIFAWYNLAGAFATALGALAAGGISQLLQSLGYTPLLSYRVIVLGYGMIGILLVGLFAGFLRTIEAPANLRSAACT